MRATHQRLYINVDHVATIRNARGGDHPDPVRAAEIVAGAGGDGITAHLREDRRHIGDEDIARLMARLSKPLNLEMAATEEMTAIALRHRPHAACLVPERRAERTTEGGLDVVAGRGQIAPVVSALRRAGIRVSLFIAADAAQIDVAAAVGAPVIEIHTGAWCDAVVGGNNAAAAAEFARIKEGAARAAQLGLEVHAGHGLDYVTAEAVSALPAIAELNIGHFIMGEAIFDGLAQVIERMRAAMTRGRMQTADEAPPSRP